MKNIRLLINKFLKRIFGPSNKMTLSLTASKEFFDHFNDLKSDMGCKDNSEFIRRLLILADFLRNHVADGGNVILRDANGNEEKLPSEYINIW